MLCCGKVKPFANCQHRFLPDAPQHPAPPRTEVVVHSPMSFKSQACLTYTFSLCIAQWLALLGVLYCPRFLLLVSPVRVTRLHNTSHRFRIAFRPLHSSASSASPEHVSSFTSSTSSITSIVNQGTNQLSLEQPRNNAGA